MIKIFEVLGMMKEEVYNVFCKVNSLRHDLDNFDLVELAAKIMSLRVFKKEDIKHYFEHQYKENTQLMKEYFQDEDTKR